MYIICIYYTYTYITTGQTDCVASAHTHVAKKKMSMSSDDRERTAIETQCLYSSNTIAGDVSLEYFNACMHSYIHI